MALDAGTIVFYVFIGIIAFVPAIVVGGGIIIFGGMLVLWLLSTILRITRIYDCIFYFTPQEFRHNNDGTSYPSDYPDKPTSVFFCTCDPFICLFQFRSLWQRVTKNLRSSSFRRRTKSSDLLPTYREQSPIPTLSIAVQEDQTLTPSSATPNT